MAYKKPVKSSRIKTIRTKSKTGLMWTGLLTVLYFAHMYVSNFFYIFVAKTGLELAFEKQGFIFPLEYLIIAAQIFVVSAVVMLIARYVLGVKKEDMR